MANILMAGLVLFLHFYSSEQKVSSCGVRHFLEKRFAKRVVGGHDATPYSWPWQVHMLISNGDGTFRHKCGGALIDRNWIVTAAHCVFANPDPRDYKIILGDFDRSKKDRFEQTFDVSKIFAHRRFLTDKQYGYDVAVMKLSRDAIFTSAVAPVCLPQQGVRANVGSKCYITGWGKTHIKHDKSQTLKQAVMPIVDQTTCNNGNSWFQQVDNASMICGGYGGASEISGCNGDSGGPFVCEEGGRWVLRGVVSWGDPKCSARSTFSVFARISTFVNWIKQTMASSDKQPAPPQIERCVDDHYYCKVWKTKGYCDSPWFNARMAVDCRKTCGHCSVLA